MNAKEIVMRLWELANENPSKDMGWGGGVSAHPICVRLCRTASKADRFREMKLLVQVKHHSGMSDTWAAEQLQEILRQTPAKYADFSLAVVTTAEASEKLKIMCVEHKIALLDGEDVVDWIFDSLSKVSSEWKMVLGIISVPELAVL
jgi:hypothetical protein